MPSVCIKAVRQLEPFDLVNGERGQLLCAEKQQQDPCQETTHSSPSKGQALLLSQGEYAGPVCCCVQAKAAITGDSVQERSKLHLP